MSQYRDQNTKQRRNENVLKNLPSEVLLKARSTLFSLGGALKSRPEKHQLDQKHTKQDSRDKKNEERLKSSRSEPEFSEIRKNKHRSLIDNDRRRQHGTKPRPLSVGATKRHDRDTEDFHGNFIHKTSPLNQRRFDSMEEVCVQSRLVIPVIERLGNQDAYTQDINDRPRKKLSFREPEIVSSGSATLGRSHKLMGVNSLQPRPNKLALRSQQPYSSLDGIDSDLESQAMRIVRTVGQAFEVCHKMQSNTPEQPEPSTSTVEEPAPSVSDVHVSKAEAASDCGASETGAASNSKVVVETAAVEDPPRPKHLELLPPPPRKESRRSPQRTPAPSINLPDLPECVTKVEVSAASEIVDTPTPLSAQHQLQLLRERLEQQAQQTRAAVAQLLLLRDQLAAEQAARCEAQARTHQLLVHNKELLEHIAALVAHLQERERGSSRPISAQQLTLLPQYCQISSMIAEGAKDAIKTESFQSINGNAQKINSDAVLNVIAQSNKVQVNQNLENNNVRLSPLFSISPLTPTTPTNGPASAPCLGGMSNEEIQNYLISKFQQMGNDSHESCKNNNQQYFQNCNAFPNIPPLTNHYSNSDLSSLLNHTTYKDGFNTEELTSLAQSMSVGHSDNSLYSTSAGTTSKDSIPDAFSSDDGVTFIMPLSHKGTLTATGEDGRVRLIVPVSPSGSSSNVPESVATPQQPSGSTLQVPGAELSLAAAAPITRSTSEKVPNRSEMMTVLRSQWTRHTTK